MIKFDKKEIIGMIHLSGPDVVEKAMEEIKIYEEEGLSGIIVENYHGGMLDVLATLNALKDNPTTMSVGINILPNEYEEAFKFAQVFDFIKFIQLDFITGTYEGGRSLDYRDLITKKIELNLFDLQIYGGVWPKYYSPIEGSDMVQDVREAVTNCNAIVVTGSGTGKETPLDKIKKFRSTIDERWGEILFFSQGTYFDADGNKASLLNEKRPLIVGAGVTPLNARECLEFADGAIVGSAFKPNGRTHQMVDRDLVRCFMDEVNKIK